MKKIVRKSPIPIYATAVVWLLYALFFPLCGGYHPSPSEISVR